MATPSEPLPGANGNTPSTETSAQKPPVSLQSSSDAATGGKPDEILPIVASAIKQDDPADGMRQLAEQASEGAQRKPLTPEQKGKLASDAMREFEDVFDGLQSLKGADRDFVEQVGRAAMRIAHLPFSGEYKRDLLAGPIDRMAEQFGRQIQGHIVQLGQQAKQLGLGRSHPEGEMRSLLRQITATDDPMQKTVLMQQASELFRRTTQQIAEIRSAQWQQRHAIQQNTKDNADRARGALQKAKGYTGGQLSDDSAPFVYEKYSRFLARQVNERDEDITLRERLVMSDNKSRLERFLRIMAILNADMTSGAASSSQVLDR